MGIITPLRKEAKRMRVDPRLSNAERNSLTQRQLFFIECWGSLSHKESSDTDRVSFNNILNALNELLELIKQGNKFKGPEKRVRASEELLEILKDDYVLQNNLCGELPQQIKIMLDSKNAWSDKARNPVEKLQGLMQSLFIELRQIIESDYVSIAIRLLSEAIDKNDPVTDEDYTYISKISNNLMSVLLTRGMPLAECYLIYKRSLHKTGVTFEERFQSWAKKVDVKKQKFKIKLRLEGERLYDMLATTSNGIEFNGCHYAADMNNDKKGAEVIIFVDAISALSARTRADFILKDSLDVVTYMAGNSQIEIRNRFYVAAEDRSYLGVIAGFSNEILTNSDRLTLAEFSHFMQAISSLCAKSTPESVKKISSAFHFLRNGLVNTKTQENKFTSLWSALEALTLNVSSKQLEHDEHVIYTAAPCMGLDYITKQLISIRGAASALNISFNHNGSNLVIDSNVSLLTLYEYMKSPQFILDFDGALSNYPYAAFMLRKFSTLCQSPRAMGCKIKQHSKKVELHIYRLYILRNAIIHNADSSPYFDLLNSNLVHYLRGSINAMYYTAEMLDVVSSPEEAFQRYLHFYRLLAQELEPTFDADPNDKKTIENYIKDGHITPSDSKLKQWLSLHH